MAAYFSNQAASRFLANSPQNNNQPSTNQVSNSTQNIPQPSASSAPRRLPSKHFSTSVATPPRQKDALQAVPSAAVPSPTSVHPLRNTWVFWFRQQRAPGNKITNYEEGIKKISAFSSVESYWSLWTHLAPPSALQPTTDYLLFHTGVRRPIWEDPLNLGGGKWIVRLKKGVADRLWEDLVMAVIGDQFDECCMEGTKEENGESKNPSGNADAEDGADGEKDQKREWPEICGCTISVRQSEDIISLWNRVDGDVKLREKIRDTLRKVLNLPPSTIMEYKSNNDSMQDKSSFRNSAIDRTPIS